MKVATYTRISSDPTGRALGVERQAEDCEKLAEGLGWEVSKRFSDNDISAYSGKRRPGYEALLAAIEAGEVGAVIAFHTDRLHRSPIELERFIEVVDKAGAEIRTVQGGTLDLSTSQGRMIARIAGSVARQESEHSSERQVRANQQKAAKGVWQAARRPFGYTLAGEPLEPEASAVREAVAGVLSGKSVRQVAREWNEAGLTTAYGGKVWTATSVRRVLKNPRYAALRVYRGAVVGDGDWTPLVDPDAHRGIVALLDDPARSSNVSFERKWQGSGVYVCGVCSAALVVHVDAKKNRAYKCPSNHVRRQGVKLDAYIDGLVVERLSRPEVRLIVDSLPGVDVPALQVERNALQGRSEVLTSMFTRGDLDGSSFDRGMGELRESIQRVEDQMAAARLSSPLLDLVLSGDELSLRWNKLSPDLRGKVISSLMIVTVLISPKGLRDFNPEFVGIEWLV
ncbi:serine recombinase [Rhodococcus sp. 14-2496-1d]|uniref:recombinase family protein n=1 Tax=Rhodococcus sp. 14-2496-1d TaxID=2023146 RepID=UPI000B9C52FB|nr:recombinase family protein [Rhodococcus sp. 14-2496-1d]OZF39949.1 serine recombinase [Rhodococcus sp. 14-2496-1d]